MREALRGEGRLCEVEASLGREIEVLERERRTRKRERERRSSRWKKGKDGSWRKGEAT